MHSRGKSAPRWKSSSIPQPHTSSPAATQEPHAPKKQPLRSGRGRVSAGRAVPRMGAFPARSVGGGGTHMGITSQAATHQRVV